MGILYIEWHPNDDNLNKFLLDKLEVNTKSVPFAAVDLDKETIKNAMYEQEVFEDAAALLGHRIWEIQNG